MIDLDPLGSLKVAQEQLWRWREKKKTAALLK